MRTTDLKLLNYVIFPDFYDGSELVSPSVVDKIVSIDYFRKSVSSLTVECNVNLVRPVPLTDQWFNDFGLSEKKIAMPNGILIDIKWFKSTEIYFILYNDLYIELDSVHTLQNVYQFFTKELLIKKDSSHDN